MKFNQKIKELMETMTVTPLNTKRTANSLKSKWKYAKDAEGNKVRFKKSEEEIKADREKLLKNHKSLAKATAKLNKERRKALGIDPSKEIDILNGQEFIEEDGDKVIRTSYETWDEEDIEAGDTDKRGWEDEEGVVFETVEDAIKWLKDQGAVHPSDSRFRTGTWYSTEDELNFTTGERTIRSFHLKGFSGEEEEEIYNAIA